MIHVTKRGFQLSTNFDELVLGVFNRYRSGPSREISSCSDNDDVSISGTDLSEVPGLQIGARRTRDIRSKFEMVHAKTKKFEQLKVFR